MIPDFAAYQHLPRFADGRIDFTHAKEAMGVHVIASYEKEFLLLKRSDKVLSARGEWLFCGGYLDEAISLEEKALAELQEETGITHKDVRSITVGESFSIEGDMTWHIYTVIVKLKKKPSIILDWEHTAFAWVQEKDVLEYVKLPGARRTMSQIISKDSEL